MFRWKAVPPTTACTCPLAVPGLKMGSDLCTVRGLQLTVHTLEAVAGLARARSTRTNASDNMMQSFDVEEMTGLEGRAE